MPVHHRHTGDEEQALCGESPIGIALPRHEDAHHIGEHQTGDGDDARLLVHHVAEQPGTLYGAEAGGQEAQEHIAAEPKQVGIAIEVSDERCTQVEHCVERATHEDVEPEDGIVVPVGGLPEIAESGHEAALLQCAGQVGKDREHGYLAIVTGREQSQEEDAEQRAQQLHSAIVQSSP